MGNENVSVCRFNCVIYSFLVLALSCFQPATYQASTPAQMHLAGLETLDVKVRIVDLGSVEGERVSLSQAAVLQEVEGLLGRFGLASSLESAARFRIVSEVSDADSSKSLVILTRAFLLEPVILERSPSTRPPNGAQTWWSDRLEVVPERHVDEAIRRGILSLTEEFSRDAMVARKIQQNREQESATPR